MLSDNVKTLEDLADYLALTAAKQDKQSNRKLERAGRALDPVERSNLILTAEWHNGRAAMAHKIALILKRMG